MPPRRGRDGGGLVGMAVLRCHPRRLFRREARCLLAWVALAAWGNSPFNPALSFPPFPWRHAVLDSTTHIGRPLENFGAACGVPPRLQLPHGPPLLDSPVLTDRRSERFPTFSCCILFFCRLRLVPGGLRQGHRQQLPLVRGHAVPVADLRGRRPDPPRRPLPRHRRRLPHRRPRRRRGGPPLRDPDALRVRQQGADLLEGGAAR